MLRISEIVSEEIKEIFKEIVREIFRVYSIIRDFELQPFKYSKIAKYHMHAVLLPDCRKTKRRRCFSRV